MLGCMPSVAFCVHVLVLAEVDYSRPGAIAFSRARLVPLCTFAEGTPTLIEKAPIIAIAFAGGVALAATGLILYKVFELRGEAHGGWCSIQEAMSGPAGPWFRMLFRFVLFVAYVLVATIAWYGLY